MVNIFFLLFIYYLNFDYRSPWTQTDSETLIKELDESFDFIEKNYLDSSKYLDGDKPNSCDALLFANLVKLYSVEIPSLKTIIDKHIILRNYFEMISNIYFKNALNPALKVKLFIYLFFVLNLFIFNF